MVFPVSWRCAVLTVLLVFLGLRDVLAFLPPYTSPASSKPTANGRRVQVIARQELQPQQRTFTNTLWMSSTSTSSNVALSLYEQFRDRLPTTAVTEAVQAKSGAPVIVADIAASAGVSLSQAQRELQLLASLTLADIAVSKDGDLIYRFPRDVKGVLAQQSAQYKARQAFEKSWPTVFWGLRVGFGVALVVSLVAIYSTIFFISSSSSSSDDDRRRDDRRGGMGGGLGGGFNYFWGPSPLDFFFYRPYGMYGYYGSPQYANKDPEELGFFESVFSYVFGDGNPNAQLETTRLALAAQMIRDNRGAVTAEQLAPYCDPEITPKEAAQQTHVDESFVLPIVTQLNGEPQVTDDGDIVYIFPELQSTASKSLTTPATASTARDAKTALVLKRAGLPPTAKAADIQRLLNYNGISTRGIYDQTELIQLLEKVLGPLSAKEQAKFEQEIDVQDPTLLTEREIPFSVATGFNQLLAGGLGVLNLGGALFLGNQLSQLSVLGYKLPSYYGAVQALYPFLLAYAILFNAIPVVRNVWIQRQNMEIRQRNTVRKQWRQAIGSSFGNVARKLKAARAMGQSLRRLGTSKQDIIFDTSTTSIEELEITKQSSDMEDFDKKLKGGSASSGGDGSSDAFQ